MQVYKTFLKIAKSNCVNAAVYFVIFLGIMIALSNVTSGENGRFSATSLDICVMDEDNSSASKALCDYISHRHNIVELSSTEEEVIQDQLYYGGIYYALTIPKGFEKQLLAGEQKNLVQSTKRKDSASGYFLDEQLDQYMQTLSAYLTGGYDLDTAIQKTATAFDNLPQVKEIQFEEEEKKGQGSVFYFFQFIPYFLIMVLFVGLVRILNVYHEKDLENRINCSALSVGWKNFQISLGCITYSIIVWILLIVASVGIYGVDAIFSTNGLYCMGNSLVCLLVSIALALVVSIFSPNANEQNMIANVMGLGMSFLCGVFVEQSMLSGTVTSIARFLPTYWYVRTNDMIAGFSNETFSMGAYGKYIGIQFVFFFAIFSVYLVGSKQMGRRKSV